MTAQWFEVTGPQGPFRVLVVAGRVAAVSFGGDSYVQVGDIWFYARGKLVNELHFFVCALTEEA